MKALITGVTGQDGAILSRQLLKRGYSVVGLARRCSHDNTERVRNIQGDFTLIEGDVSDFSSILSIIQKHEPDHIYNLAAQSHVHTSFSQPIYTTDVVYGGALNILEAIRHTNPSIRMYQASSSEMFGDSHDIRYVEGESQYYQDEYTPFNPQSPYAIAKLAAHHLVRLYRKSYNIFACSGILFNHESEYRGVNFVTRKISLYVAKLYMVGGNITKIGSLHLGNLTACRDWGYAPDYTRAMYMMLEADEPSDYVIGTGETHSVQEFVQYAFQHIGIKNWQDFVTQDQSLMRPSEVPFLCASPKRANLILNWTPETSFKELVDIMVDHDIVRQQRKTAVAV